MSIQLRVVLTALLVGVCCCKSSSSHSVGDAAATVDADADAATVDSGPGTLRNPIRPGSADPFLFHFDGSYYLTYTAVDRIVLVKATSVAELGAAAPTVIWTDSTPSRCCNIWAPEVHRIGSRWYVYYTADDGQIQNHRQYVLESAGDDPMGPYTFKAQLATQDFFAIDGTVMDLNGTTYFVWSGVPPGGVQSLYIAPMINAWTLGGAPALLSLPYLPWEVHGGSVNEGPIALQHDGKTFIVFSASQCSTPYYTLGTLTYKGGDPLDNTSWEKSDSPQFAQSPEHGVYGPGHNSFFMSPDGSEIWNAYHATDNPAGSCGGDRSLRVQKVDWNADGSPDFGIPVSETASLTLPSGDPGPAKLTDGSYVITAQLNGLALTVKDCSDAPGADVVEGAFAGHPCETWRITAVGNGTYKLTAGNGDQVLQVDGCSTADHGDVHVGADTGAMCQQWYLDALGGGFYRISAGHDGYPLDIDACNASAGTPVNIWHQWHPGCQTWRLAPAP